MKTGIVLRQMLRERRRGVLWWSVAIAALTAITAASYPAVKDAGSVFDQLMEQMPEGMLELFGAEGGITSPGGYLNSQLYSNILPILLLVYGIGMAAWSIAGTEREGTLEPLLANPVSRSQVALERFAGTSLLLTVPMAVSTILLIATRSPFELDELGVGELIWVGVGTYLLVLLFVSLTYAVGAATGSRGAAIAVGAGVAAGTYVIFGLSSFVDFFDSVRWLSPWDWFLSNSPLTDEQTWPAFVWPLVVIAVAVPVGTAILARRDLG
ncbi:MAG TPA: ABC transporter permease subunit [Jiangellaceae bacterium]